MSTLYSYGIGVATRNSKQEIIEIYYPSPQLSPSAELSSEICEALDLSAQSNSTIELSSDSIAKLRVTFSKFDDRSYDDELAMLNHGDCDLVACLLFKDEAPTSIAEVFLKLHLLSHRIVKPHGTNLNGMFGILKNLAWTNIGPIDLEDLPQARLEARLKSEFLSIETVDKFPMMTNYVVPKGVRIADTARVRLGAYLGEGTTIMHEGFVNFNAGTMGAAMIEGRISAGVVVGENSDLGGGCSTMGTLSGGGTELISVGEQCLIGANGGIGFPLADGCIVEAGLYVTAGTKVELLDSDGESQGIVKALELSGRPHMLFRRHSQSGAVQCVPLKDSISLNEELHAHN